MAYTTDQLTALETALAKGEKSVTFADRTIVYRTVDEMLSAMREIKRNLALSVAAPTVRHIRVNSEKGF
jgi:hypothetical protein